MFRNVRECWGILGNVWEIIFSKKIIGIEYRKVGM